MTFHSEGQTHPSAVWQRVAGNLRSFLNGAVSEQLRLPIQMTVAAVLAFLVGSFFGMEAVGWAVISAVFVVHGTFDGTLQSALWRVAGAVIGGLIALAGVMTIGTGGFATIATLGVSMAVMSGLIAWKPQLSFGLVTVAFIIISPGLQVVEGAFEKAMAIAGGAAVGISVSMLVLRRRAPDRVTADLAETLEIARSMVEESTESLLGGETPGDDIEDKQKRSRSLLNAARQDAAEIRSDILNTRKNLPFQSLISAVDDVRSAAVTLVRATPRAVASSQPEFIGEDLKTVARTIGRDFGMLGYALRGEREAEWPKATLEASKQLSHAIERTRSKEMESLPLRTSAWVFLADFAIAEIGAALERLAEALGAERPSEAADANPAGKAAA